jgi:hypothetical protein
MAARAGLDVVRILIMAQALAAARAKIMADGRLTVLSLS